MINITIRQLEVMEAVVKSDGFSAASERLDITQASVSAHISALEAQIGTSIFDRRPGRRPSLTKSGELVFQYATEILENMRLLEASLTKANKNLPTRLVFSCQRSIAHSKQSALARFALEHPEIELVIRIGTIEDVISDIRSGTADIAEFISHSSVSKIPSRIVGQAQLVLVAPSDHPLNQIKSVDPKLLASYPFVGPPSSAFGTAVRQAMQGSGVPAVNIVARTTEYQQSRELVLAGVGLACSFKSSVEQDVKDGRIQIIDLAAKPMMLNIRLAVNERKPVSEQAKIFIKYLEEAQLHQDSLT